MAPFEALGLLGHNRLGLTGSGAAVGGVKLPDQVSDLVVNDVLAVRVLALVPIIGCVAPPVGVDGDNIVVLAAHPPPGNQWKAQFVDFGGLGKYHPVLAGRVGPESESGLSPAPRIVQGGQCLLGECLVAEIADPCFKMQGHVLRGRLLSSARRHQEECRHSRHSGETYGRQRYRPPTEGHGVPVNCASEITVSSSAPAGRVVDRITMRTNEVCLSTSTDCISSMFSKPCSTELPSENSQRTELMKRL